MLLVNNDDDAMMIMMSVLLSIMEAHVWTKYVYTCLEPVWICKCLKYGI